MNEASPILAPRLRAECEEIALETRDELKLSARERLDPSALADYLDIDAIPIEVFAEEEPESVHQLVAAEPYVFSAVTFVRGTRRTIVYNSRHSPRRHANTMAHELAHVLLEHDPGPLFDDDGRRLLVPIDEATADYLAGALLVPRCAVASTMNNFSDSLVAAAEHFGVSKNLMAARVLAASSMERLAAAEVAAMLRLAEEEAPLLRRQGLTPSDREGTAARAAQ